MDELFKEYADKIPAPILEQLKAALPEKVSKTDLKKIFEALLEEYEMARVDAGESVGLVAAESIGERGTQMTLDSKHMAAVARLSETGGLPRLIEIFDGRKTLSSPLTEIYLEDNTLSAEDVSALAARIKQNSLDDLATSFEVNLADGTVDVELDAAVLKQLNVKADAVAKVLSKSLKSVTAKAESELKIILKLAKDADLDKLYALKEKAKSTYVCGIKDIVQVLPVRQDDEYVIMASGTNLKKILEVPGVDPTRTRSNDIHEVQKVLGVEAARALIIQQTTRVLEEQGLDVNVRHIMLASDTMCATGSIKGITRYGIVGEKSSVLARASFETPIKHIFAAAERGEKDHLRSVIENVMINQTVPSGTGLPKLTVTLDKQ